MASIFLKSFIGAAVCVSAMADNQGNSTSEPILQRQASTLTPTPELVTSTRSVEQLCDYDSTRTFGLGVIVGSATALCGVGIGSAIYLKTTWPEAQEEQADDDTQIARGM